MEYLITLIHGTFAKAAPWTKDSSIFCHDIKERLWPENVTFARHIWSGRNSHSTRIRESELLAEKLRRQIIEEPGKKKIIIAHSHGGNIALYALKKLETENTEFDLITLATPFLNSEKRDFARNLRLHYLIAPIIPCLLLFFLFTRLLLIIFRHDDDTVWVTVAIFSVIIMTILFGTWLNDVLKRKFSTLPDRLDLILEKVQFNTRSFNNNILSLVDYSDEVKIWFGSLIYIWEGILRLHNFLCRIVAPLYIFVSVLCFLFMFEIVAFLISRNDYLPWLPLVLAYSGWILCILVLLLPLITYLLPALFFLIKSNPLILGWESWLHQMFIKTSPATTPFGLNNLKFIQYNIRKTKRISLRHSLYEEKQVIDDISKWIINLKK